MNFLSTTGKKEKKELPQWYQESAVGQYATQQQDKAQEWFGDLTSGITEPVKQYTDPLKQYGDQLKQQGQEWFLQTPVGEGVNDFYSGLMAPLQTATDTTRQTYQNQLNTTAQKYQDQLNSIYSDAMKKWGLSQ